MSNKFKPDMWIEIDEAEVEGARRLATARLVEVARQQSAHRPTARNQAAQFRGAAGELAARKWVISADIHVESGFELDLPQHSDLTVGDQRIEIMTAQIAHREVTGFCVPPGKLNAARRRRALGYLFVGTGPEQEPRRFLIQGFAPIDVIDRHSARQTRVSERSPSVLNFVVSEEDLLAPGELIDRLVKLKNS